MNSLLKFTVITLIFSVTFSCQTETKSVDITVKNELAAAYKKNEFHIKGMTCEIGCARLIQSKLSKENGVKFIKVSFKDSLGMIEYDSNKLNSNKINKIISKIAGGELYKVTDSKEVTEFKQLK